MNDVLVKSYKKELPKGIENPFEKPETGTKSCEFCNKPLPSNDLCTCRKRHFQSVANYLLFKVQASQSMIKNVSSKFVIAKPKRNRYIKSTFS